jgi:hypothetical protein
MKGGGGVGEAGEREREERDREERGRGRGARRVGPGCMLRECSDDDFNRAAIVEFVAVLIRRTAIRATEAIVCVCV